MGADTKIQWTHHTFNPWWGCARVSPGCERCYAESFAKRVGQPVWGVQASRRFFGEAHWAEPLKWNRKAEAAGERHRVFCASMADVFEDRPDLVPHRERLWTLIAKTPALDWLLLTKRPENIRKLAPWRALVEENRYDDRPEWPRNVWIGVTVEDQRRAEERIPWLLEVPAVVRFVSCEPLLEPVDLENVTPYYLKRGMTGSPYEPIVLIDALRGHVKGPDEMLDFKVDWVIVGGESGGKARAFNPTWAKAIVDRCREAGVAPFVKQLGANVLDFAGAIRDRAGGDWDEWPADLRVRQFPTQRSPQVPPTKGATHNGNQE